MSFGRWTWAPAGLPVLFYEAPSAKAANSTVACPTSETANQVENNKEDELMQLLSQHGIAILFGKESAEELLLFCDDALPQPGIDLSEFTWQSFVELYSEASSGRIGSCQSSSCESFCQT